MKGKWKYYLWMMTFLMAWLPCTYVNAESTDHPLQSMEIKKTNVEVGDVLKLQATLQEDYFDKPVGYIKAEFISPSGNVKKHAFLSVDKESALWTGNYQVEEFIENGEWKLTSLTVGYRMNGPADYNSWSVKYDQIGNYSFTVENNETEDLASPTIQDVSIIKDQERLQASDSVRIEAKVSDDLSGVVHVAAIYMGKTITMSKEESTGKYVGTFDVRASTRVGLYSFEEMIAIDKIGNKTTIDNSTLDLDFEVIESPKSKLVLSEAESYLGWYNYGFHYTIGEIYYLSIGYNLPTDMEELSTIGKKVERNNLQVGDLVFFDYEGQSKVAMYIGDNQVIHRTKSNVVGIDNINNGTYWGQRYVEGRRILDMPNYLMDEEVENMRSGTYPIYYDGNENGVDFVNEVLTNALGYDQADTIEEQAELGESIERERILSGDLVFMGIKETNQLTHVGIHTGWHGGDYIYIPTVESDNRITTKSIDDPNWPRGVEFIKAKRLKYVPGSTANDTEEFGHPLTKTADNYVGTPYQYGGDSDGGFDSSGFVQYIFNEALGFELPRTVSEQAGIGQSVAKQDLQEGDLVFFSKDEDSGLTHVAIYAGDDKIIHPTVSRGVIVGEMEGSSYWGPRYTEARRVEDQPELGSTFTHPLTQEAETHVGTPYEYGGDNGESFDSSGFVQYVFNEALDFDMPRTVSGQADIGQSVAKENLQEGDLVFFSKDEDSGLTHVAIYAGDDQIIHPTVSQGVVVGEMEGNSYWGPRYTEARRVEDQPELGSAFTHPLTQSAETHLGTPYEYGGDNGESFDSSGFVKYVFNEALGLELPRTVSKQANLGQAIAKEDLQQGDLVFFSKDEDSGLTHVAIYAGDDQIIHPTVSKGVVVGEMEGNSYWGPRYTEARRVEDQPELGAKFTHPLTQAAETHLGTPYEYGGDNGGAFDSSGFVQYLFSEALGLELPRTVSEQAGLGQSVEKEDLQEGDLVFFSKDEDSGVTHVAIYAGNDQIIHPTVSQGVVVGEMEGSSYWGPRYTEARRVGDQPELGSAFTHPLTQAAETHVGMPYEYGGDNGEAFDSSGFVQYVFNEALGLELPRTVSEQANLGQFVAKEDLQEGDLVFFSKDEDSGVTHVAIYAGDDQIIHPTVSQGVVVGEMESSSYWGPRYTEARRVE
ncbi:C40 family peptidase [Halobacillus faecis]|uniref:NlpC/P60 domain-containing protein n=1 Tax=Halobacillus faecis TaxID=360184 RepID=A0A511WYC8_9BACI|nr:NlpC/P60 family protein [Halobacillus faecis]GEN54532.1 hypothetical protein HFA01_27940 [Halobacillus faecis]